MGKCRYVFAKHVGTFEVLQKNARCGGSGATCTQEITVNVKGIKIHIVRGGPVTIGGVPVTPPYNRAGRKKKNVSTKFNRFYNVKKAKERDK